MPDKFSLSEEFAKYADEEISPEEEKFVMAVGLVVLLWARVEQGIDMCILAIARETESWEKLPTTAQRKILYVRKTFENSPQYQQLASEGIPLMDRAMAIKDARNELMHSAVEDQGEKGVFNFHELRALGNDYASRKWAFDLKKFPDLAATLLGLTHDLWAFLPKMKPTK